jgi:hypothetical protein
MGELSAEGYFKQKEETLIDLIPATRQATGLGNAFRILLFKQGVGQFSVVTTGQFSVAITKGHPKAQTRGLFDSILKCKQPVSVVRPQSPIIFDPTYYLLWLEWFQGNTSEKI